MEPSTLRQYFQSKLSEKSIPRPLQSQILSKLKPLHQTVIKNFPNPKPTAFLSGIIKRITKNFSEIEENIRKNKLKSAIRSKKELEEKLLFISQSIDHLQEDRHKKTQQEIHDEQKKKAEDFAQQIKKFTKLNKETEGFIKAQTEKTRKKAKILEENDLILAEKIREKREAARLQELEKLRIKRENREKILEQLKQSQSSTPVPSKKPLYLKFEEDFRKNVEMPELEKRKQELKKKSEFFRSYQPDAVRDHSKWYKEVRDYSLSKIQEDRKKNLESQSKSMILNNSFWALKIKEEEKKIEEEKQMKEDEKKRLLERKAKYVELLKELHPPLVGPAKSLKIENSKEEKQKNSEDQSVASVQWKPHKFKPNHMVPAPKKALEPKKVLYLEDKRKERQEKAEDDPGQRLAEELETAEINNESLKKVQKTANKLEELARKKELALETKPLSIGNISQSASVDSMLLSSIKAKLRVLENIS